MTRKVKAAFSTPSLGKKLLFWLIILAAPLFALELGLRTYFAFQLGSSTFFYGTSVNREKGGDAHSGDLHILDGYFKYHPHQGRLSRAEFRPAQGAARDPRHHAGFIVDVRVFRPR
jgi:hypothetical protein